MAAREPRGPESTSAVLPIAPLPRHGTGQLAIPEVLEVPPIWDHGNFVEIAAQFGGAEKLSEAVSRLRELLYAA
jgi:hypothetical protein